MQVSYDEHKKLDLLFTPEVVSMWQNVQHLAPNAGKDEVISWLLHLKVCDFLCEQLPGENINLERLEQPLARLTQNEHGFNGQLHDVINTRGDKSVLIEVGTGMHIESVFLRKTELNADQNCEVFCISYGGAIETTLDIEPGVRNDIAFRTSELFQQCRTLLNYTPPMRFEKISLEIRSDLAKRFMAVQCLMNCKQTEYNRETDVMSWLRNEMKAMEEDTYETEVDIGDPPTSESSTIKWGKQQWKKIPVCDEPFKYKTKMLDIHDNYILVKGEPHEDIDVKLFIDNSYVEMMQMKHCFEENLGNIDPNAIAVDFTTPKMKSLELGTSNLDCVTQFARRVLGPGTVANSSHWFNEICNDVNNYLVNIGNGKKTSMKNVSKKASWMLGYGAKVGKKSLEVKARIRKFSNCTGKDDFTEKWLNALSNVGEDPGAEWVTASEWDEENIVDASVRIIRDRFKSMIKGREYLRVMNKMSSFGVAVVKTSAMKGDYLRIVPILTPSENGNRKCYGIAMFGSNHISSDGDAWECIMIEMYRDFNGIDEKPNGNLLLWGSNWIRVSQTSFTLRELQSYVCSHNWLLTVCQEFEEKISEQAQTSLTTVQLKRQCLMTIIESNQFLHQQAALGLYHIRAQNFTHEAACKLLRDLVTFKNFGKQGVQGARQKYQKSIDELNGSNCKNWYFMNLINCLLDDICESV